MAGEPWDVRQEIEGRPSLFALLGLVVGLTAVSHPFNLLALPVLFWLRSLRGRAWCAAFLIFGLVAAPRFYPGLTSREFISDHGTVVASVIRQGSTQRTRVQLDRGEFFLLLKGGPALVYGDRISVRGVAAPLGSSETRLGTLLTAGTLTAGDRDVVVEAESPFISRIAETWRASYRDLTRASLPDEANQIAFASLFGAGDMSPQLSRRLRGAGAVSVLSVSGLQVVLLSGLLVLGLGRLPLSRRSHWVILAVFLLVYCTAAGLHPGIIRAALMTTLMFGAFNLRREPDILSALALTAILELLWRPSWIYEFGFQLSFVAVATIALWLPHRSKTTHKPIASRILFVAASVVVMFVAAAPIIAYQTGELNLAAPVVGCLIVPAIPPLVAFGLLGWGLALASPLIAGFWMKLTVAPFAGWVLAASELSGRASGFQIAIPPFNAYVLLPVYVLLAYGSRFTSNAFSGEKTFGERR